MQKNVGNMDRNIRIALGAILLILGIKPDLIGLSANGALHWVLLIAGIAAIATGVFRFCGLYTLLGINTCKLK